MMTCRRPNARGRSAAARSWWAAPLAALLAAGAAAAAQDRDPVAEAESRVEQARQASQQAFDALESLVLDLQDDYAHLVTDPGAPTLKNALSLALAESLEAAQSRILAGEAQGRRLLRGARRRILVEVFDAPVRRLPGLDPRLSLWVAEQVAENLSARSSLDGVDREDVLRLVDALFDPKENWYQFWNRTFAAQQDLAARYAEAQQDYEEAGLALDRLRHPERYGPRGQPAPPGMVVVPGGAYELGPNSGWPRPRRRVSLDAFALDRAEVTHREYAQFVNAQPDSARPALLPRGWSLDPNDGMARHDPARRDHPVVFVSWTQAAAFAAWSGKRLPTEDEWEAAAAGPSGRAYPWGDEFQAGLCNGVGGTGTVPVESYPAGRSRAGGFDMAGNVWEWTATLEDGKDVQALPEGLVNLVIRGGGYGSPREELATRFRWTALGQDTFGHPGYERPIGFRCAKDLE